MITKMPVQSRDILNDNQNAFIQSRNILKDNQNACVQTPDIQNDNENVCGYQKKSVCHLNVKGWINLESL